MSRHVAIVCVVSLVAGDHYGANTGQKARRGARANHAEENPHGRGPAYDQHAPPAERTRPRGHF